MEFEQRVKWLPVMTVRVPIVRVRAVGAAIVRGQWSPAFQTGSRTNASHLHRTILAPLPARLDLQGWRRLPLSRLPRPHPA